MKEIYALIAIILSFATFFLYIRAILQGKAKPHVFSWVVWGTVTCIVFIAQLADGGGMGAWPIGISGVSSLCIAMMAYSRRLDITITRGDAYCFVGAMTAIPIWYLTHDPLWAVLLLTFIDVLGFIPTLRKAYVDPFTEPLLYMNVIIVRNILAIVALEHYSVTTVLFPAVIGACCVLLLMIVTMRRYQVQLQVRQ